ncbi:tetratricopeptide repeat-containing sensor histidine kinase [Roseivirga echinicomitans]
MNFIKRLFIAVALMLSLNGLNAQNTAQIDELIDATAKSLRDPFLTIVLADSLHQLSEKAAYDNGIAAAAKFKGIGLYYSGKRDSAFIYYEKSRILYTELKDTLEMGKAYLNLAIYYNSIADYTNSVSNSLEALDYFREKNDSNGVGRVLNVIGQSYYYQNDFSSAATYFRNYLNNAYLVGDSVEISSGLTNLGSVFQKLNLDDSALIYLEKAVRLKERINFLGNIGSSYMSIAGVYWENEDFDKASLAYDKALKYYRNVNDSLRISELYLQLAKVALKQENYKEASTQVNKALTMANAVKAREVRRESLELMAHISANSNEYKSAYGFLNQYVALNDSLMNQNNLENLNYLREEFQTKEKEQQIALQEAQLGEQYLKLQRNRLLLIGLVLIAILFLTVIFLTKNRAKKNEQLILQEAQLKLRDAELNAVINSQEKERNRFARDLHDGFGQLISVLKLNLSSLNDKDAQYPEKRLEVFKNGESVINDMYAELRSICFDLMPQTLVKKGLTIALKEFGDRISQSKKVVCEVIVFSNKERLPELVEISLFRICQEWVNNVMKYAEASHITIQLTRDETELTLTVEDDGKGFDAERFYSGTGNGWKNIQTRLNLIKGEFDLDTHPERRGTMMTVNLSELEVKVVFSKSERSIRV